MTSLLFISIVTFAQTEKKEKYINDITKNTTCIFEGSVIETKEAFYDKNGNIFTLIKVKVSKVNFGQTESTEVLIARKGGTIGNREELSSHGGSYISDYNTFFLNNNFVVIEANTNKSYYLVNNIAYDENFNIIGNEKNLFKNYNDFYTELAKSISVSYEKKSPLKEDVNQIKNEDDNISYETRIKNYNDIVAPKIKAAKNNISAKTNVVNDLTLQILNGTINGGFYEYDINVKANNSLTYLENVNVHLSYNPAVFNPSVVASNNVTITSGPSFSNSSYYSANAFKLDGSASTFVFVVTTSVSPVRTNITTSFILLAHVKMKIQNCGNVSTTFTNNAVASGQCLYATTPSGTNTPVYNSLTYNGNLTTNITCGPTIFNFNSPLRGGVDTLKIKGFGFGAIKGTGSVQFKDADISGFPYITQLDNQDYVFWSDTLIKVLVPSFNQNLFGSNGKNNSAGTGNFIITNNSAQTTTSNLNVSNSPFIVAFSLLSVVNPNTNQKSKIHLTGAGPNNNYKIYCDSVIGKNAYKFGLIKKVIREWGCYTTANFELIYDSTVVNTPFINYMSFNTLSVNDPNLGNTILGVDKCNNGKNVIGNFDIIFKKNEIWLFDSTGTQTLNTNTYDFYEIASHELGHSLGLQHIIDINSLMYWTPKFSLTLAITPPNRKSLLPNTEVTNGALYQISNSIASIGPGDLAACSFKTYQSYNNNCTQLIGIKEISGNQLKAKVFPNPSTDGRITLTYYSENLKESSIQINDLLGNVIYTKSNNPNENEVTETIDLTNLSSGIYILTLRSDVYKSTFKLVKQ